jgi:hypothetical protein
VGSKTNYMPPLITQLEKSNPFPLFFLWNRRGQDPYWNFIKKQKSCLTSKLKKQKNLKRK